jgi:hypothetical protein
MGTFEVWKGSLLWLLWTIWNIDVCDSLQRRLCARIIDIKKSFAMRNCRVGRQT